MVEFIEPSNSRETNLPSKLYFSACKIACGIVKSQFIILPFIEITPLFNTSLEDFLAELSPALTLKDKSYHMKIILFICIGISV